jgi:DNA-directed RNA polymerase sigma subunit (sigma70/sigma32)
MSLVINLKADTGLVLRTENTNRFYRDIKKYGTMTREEEADWFNMLSDARKKAEKAKAEGDTKTAEEMEKFTQEIKDFIVACNQRLCVAAAKNWANTDNLLDYVNEANIGLMLAVDRFDASRGVKFASYAMWFIKRAIEGFHHGVLPLVRRTNNAKTWSIISKVASDFTQKNERPPSQDELLELVNKKLKKGIKDKADLTEMYVTMVDEYSYDSDEKMFNSDAADYNRASASVNDYENQSSEETFCLNSLPRTNVSNGQESTCFLPLGESSSRSLSEHSNSHTIPASDFVSCALADGVQVLGSVFA